MTGTTGDIIWTHTDPQTWTLTNRPPAEEPEGQAGVQAPPVTITDDDKQMFAEGIRALAEKHAGEQNRHLEKLWRQQLRTFHRSLKTDPNVDQAQGMQELFDSGAAWMENGDVYTAVSQPKGKRDQLLEAARRWQQVTGADNSAGIVGDQAWENIPSAPGERTPEQQAALNEARQLPDEEYKQRVTEILKVPTP